MFKLIGAVAQMIWKKEEGLTTVEYAVAGGIIVAAVIVGFQTLGGNVGKVITNIATAIGAIPNP
jgi:pilus assembly protein Flp/PilA